MTHIDSMHSSDILDTTRLEKGVIGWFRIKREVLEKNGEKRKRKKKRKKRLPRSSPLPRRVSGVS